MAITLYHITHISNLRSIIELGGIFSNNEIEAQGGPPVDIGHNDIKERRKRKVIPITPGGTLADYVPFYFAPRSPMHFAIHKGKVSQYQGGQADIIYLLTYVELSARLNNFCFTDGHPIEAFSRFFTDLNLINTVIDWPLMKEKYWRDTPEDPDRKRRRQAEFLLYGICPWGIIYEMGAFDQKRATKVEQTMELTETEHLPKVTVRRDWYF